MGESEQGNCGITRMGEKRAGRLQDYMNGEKDGQGDCGMAMVGKGNEQGKWAIDRARILLKIILACNVQKMYNKL